MNRAREICAALAAAVLFWMSARALAADAPEQIAGNPAAPSLDVVGVKLGMTVEEARAALLRHLPGSAPRETVTEIRDYPGSRHVSGLLSIKAGADGGREEMIGVFFTPPPLPQKVVHVGRHVVYREDQKPSIDRTTSALNEKYGTPSYTGQERGPLFGWVWDNAGARRTLSAPGRCRASLLMDTARPRTPLSLPDSTEYLGALREGCSLVLTTILRVYEPGIVSIFSTALTDERMADAAIKTTQAQVARLRKGAQDEARSRGDKINPSL